MLSFSNVEFAAIVIIILFQPFTNIHVKCIILILVFLIHYIETSTELFNKYNLYKNKNKNNKSIDDIIHTYFKNSSLNKRIYAILLTDEELIQIVIRMNYYRKLDTDCFQSFLYSLWNYLKAFGYAFHFDKKKPFNENVVYEMIEKRNKVLMAITQLSYEIDNKKVEEGIGTLIQKLYYRLNHYIKLVQNKYNISGDLPIPVNVLDKYDIFI